MVKREPEDLSIVFIKIDLVFSLVPLAEFRSGFGREGLVAVDAGAANGGTDTVGLGLGIGVDVGLKTVEVEEGDIEEGEDESEEDGE